MLWWHMIEGLAFHLLPIIFYYHVFKTPFLFIIIPHSIAFLCVISLYTTLGLTILGCKSFSDIGISAFVPPHLADIWLTHSTIKVYLSLVHHLHCWIDCWRCGMSNLVHWVWWCSTVELAVEWVSDVPGDVTRKSLQHYFLITCQLHSWLPLQYVLQKYA